jgi:hypothetical protein
MALKKTKSKKGGQVPDIAAQKRASKGGQLRHNPEQPAEEAPERDVNWSPKELKKKPKS